MNKLIISTTILTILLLGTIVISMNMLQNVNAIYPSKKETGIEISNIITNPSFLPVGTNFKINATVTNNSPNTITFIGSMCGNSPLSAKFDKNVHVRPSGIITCMARQIVTLQPGENAMVTGPNAHLIYTASGIGSTKANITFNYADKTGKNNNISKPFEFHIVILKVTNESSHINTSFCPHGSLIQICNFGQHRLPIGLWNLYINGTNGFLNISTVKFNGDVRGTLQLSDNTSGPGKFCSVSKPCNIIGMFNTKTGKLTFTSTPTLPTFIADVQNYTGYESSQIQGIDTNMYKLDGIGTTIKPQPVKEFGWDASKLCIVGGPC